MGKMHAAAAPEYEADFHAWLTDQGRRLRGLRVPGLDSVNLAEEIESLGRSDRREVASRLSVLLAHLLKWQHQPAARSGSWRATILEQRQRIEAVLEDSPSLRATVAPAVPRAYVAACQVAAAETGLAFPATCPWAAADILSPDFLPSSAVP